MRTHTTHGRTPPCAMMSRIMAKSETSESRTRQTGSNTGVCETTNHSERRTFRSMSLQPGGG